MPYTRENNVHMIASNSPFTHVNRNNVHNQNITNYLLYNQLPIYATTPTSNLNSSNYNNRNSLQYIQSSTLVFLQYSERSVTLA